MATITRDAWESGKAPCLSKGRIGNARVYRVDTPEGSFVVKDFRKSPWWIRWTWGRWMIAHEYTLMKRMEGVAGIPQKLFKLDVYAFGMELLPGESLGDRTQRANDLARAARNGEAVDLSQTKPLPGSFFRALERLVCQMHRRGVTHLDTRNAKNIMVLPGDKPGLIDFQSGVLLRRWQPKWIKKILKLADLSSVYKHYYHLYCELDGTLREPPDGFPPSRAYLFLAHLRLRRFWVLKGYKVISQRKMKNYEYALRAMYCKTPQKETK